MKKLILNMASEMLGKYASDLGGRGCNDYQIEATEENIELVKDMIAKSDYPEDEPHIYNGHIDLMDWQLVRYLEHELSCESLVTLPMD